MSDTFRDHVCVITGASQGIGAEMAYQLAEQGAKLVLAARSTGKLETVAEACRQRGGEALVVATDVTDEGQCRRLIERAAGHFGRIDVLINNAGHGTPQRLADMQSLDRVRYETDLNYHGVVYCTRYALPHLQQSGGRIVGVSSLIGLTVVPGLSSYSAAKHAMTGFLRAVRVELRETPVSVTLVFPGAVRTETIAEMEGDTIQGAAVMSVERCAALIIRAAAKRRRRLIMTAQGKLSIALYRIIPSVIEAFAARVMRS